MEPRTRMERSIAFALRQIDELPPAHSRLDHFLNELAETVRLGGSTPEELQDAVDDYLTRNPVQAMTDEQIAESVNRSMAAGDIEGGGASEAEFVSYDNESLPSVTNVEEALNKLIADYYYVAPSVTAFTASPTGGTFEIGSTVTAPITFNWNYNKDITTQTLTDCTLADETTRTATYDTDITTNKTFTLSASDGKNNVSKSISYTFVYPYYTGVSATGTLTETNIIALTKKVEVKGSKTINYTTSQSHMIFAYPKSYGAIKSVIDQNGFNVTDSFTQNTVTVNGVNYYVYISNKCSGSYTMKFNY